MEMIWMEMIWMEISHFFNIKMEEWDLKFFLFNYWNKLVLASVEPYLLEVGAYVSVKEATAGVWEVIFAESDFKFHIFLI